MNAFDRNLGETGDRESSALQQLHILTEGNRDNWWKDLLRLWVPAGSGAGPNPLRLAVRNGYLNFYLRGQSVARVGFGRGRAPFAETHIKFASPEDEETRKGYVRLVGNEFLLSSSKRCDWSYEPGDTLKRWIARADKRGKRKNGSIAEKTFVDRVVARNGRVIDLEMGLPAWSESKTAKRMDLVALESIEDHLRIVFWEAKTISDKRLVSTCDPEVKEQFVNYCKYLAHSDHAEQVIAAYRKNCSILVELHSLAQQVRSDIEPLDQTIIQAMAEDQELSVCQQPRLIIFDDQDGKRTACWPEHEKKLRAWAR